MIRIGDWQIILGPVFQLVLWAIISSTSCALVGWLLYRLRVAGHRLALAQAKMDFPGHG